MEQIKKLSVAKVAGKMTPARVLKSTQEKDGKKFLPVMRVAGIAVGTKTGANDYGDWTALIGDFQAINLENGQVFRGPMCFLPEIAALPLEAALAGGAPSVQFAVDIIAKEDETSTVGFSYTCESLAPQENDPVAALLAGAAKVKPLALDAPKTTEPAKPAAKSAKSK